MSIVSMPMRGVDQRPQQRRRRKAQARAAAEDDELGLQRGDAREVVGAERLERARVPRDDARRATERGRSRVCSTPLTIDAVRAVAGDRVLALDPVGAHLHDVIIGAAQRLRSDAAARAVRRDPCGQISGCPRALASRSLPRATSSQVEQARQRLLRHPRPGPRQGAPDGGRGPAHHQAQHRQHRRVRARAAGRDRPGHDPQPAERGRLHRLQGPVRAAQGDRPLHAAEARQGRDRRRRLPRQRRVRAHHDEHERAAQRRRRGADPGARLSALDGIGRALGRNAGPLPVRRSVRLAARPRRHGGEDHAAHARRRRHQSQQPDRRALSRTSCSTGSSRSRAATA